MKVQDWGKAFDDWAAALDKIGDPGGYKVHPGESYSQIVSHFSGNKGSSGSSDYAGGSDASSSQRSGGGYTGGSSGGSSSGGSAEQRNRDAFRGTYYAPIGNLGNLSLSGYQNPYSGTNIFAQDNTNGFAPGLTDTTPNLSAPNFADLYPSTPSEAASPPESS